jgi:hypothetical protein
MCLFSTVVSPTLKPTPIDTGDTSFAARRSEFEADLSVIMRLRMRGSTPLLSHTFS